MVRSGTASTTPSDAIAPGAATLIGVPDRCVVELAQRLGDGPPCNGAIVFHSSGALGAEVLAPLRRRGIAIGGFHPAHSFADRDHPPANLRGTAFALDGDSAARALGARWVAALEGRLLELNEGGKPLHHAAASLVANALLALVDLALRLEREAGLEEPSARVALLPLMRSTLANLERSPPHAALTGPIDRGDVLAVEAHLTAIRERVPGALEAYLFHARATLELAVQKGALSAEQIEEFRALIERGAVR